jgi:hypothetical protein
VPRKIDDRHIGIASLVRDALLGKSGVAKKPNNPYGNNYGAKRAHQKFQHCNELSLSLRLMNVNEPAICEKDPPNGGPVRFGLV